MRKCLLLRDEEKVCIFFGENAKFSRAGCGLPYMEMVSKQLGNPLEHEACQRLLVICFLWLELLLRAGQVRQLVRRGKVFRATDGRHYCPTTNASVSDASTCIGGRRLNSTLPSAPLIPCWLLLALRTLLHSLLTPRVWFECCHLSGFYLVLASSLPHTPLMSDSSWSSSLWPSISNRTHFGGCVFLVASSIFIYLQSY